MAGPSTPVEILGLPSLPDPGDQLLGVTDQLKAQADRQLPASSRCATKALAASARVRLEDLGRAIAEGQLKELLIVLKADVQGSLEAVAEQLNKLPQEKIKVRIIRQGVGAITEGDVLLAAASNAVVIGFNVRPERKAAEIAERDEVELRLYTVIYDVAGEMKKAMEGLLEPTVREVRLGAAEVRDTFKISKVGTIAGCLVQDGRVTRAARSAGTRRALGHDRREAGNGFGARRGNGGGRLRHQQFEALKARSVAHTVGEQPVALLHGALKAPGAGAIAGVETQDQPVEKAAPLGARPSEQAVHGRRHPHDLDVVGKSTGTGRRLTVDAHEPAGAL